MSIFSKGSKSVSETILKDALHCVVSGTQSFGLVSPYEYHRMQVGQEFPEGGYLPLKYSPIDMFNEEYVDVKVH